MKKFSKILLSSLVTAPLILNTLPFAAADETSGAPNASQTAPVKPVELSGEKISFQYVSTVFNGQEQKPAVTVSSGETVLAEKTDFTVTYPKDCVNAGKKTVTIEGIGNYRGKFSATYLIEPLDCSDKNANIKIGIANCSYSGMPLTPDVTITANGLTLGSGDYILAFSDNVNATTEKEKAKCEIMFRGNFSGSRTAEFDIAKAPSKDLDIQVMVHNSDRFVYDLTPLKPEGAAFGEIKYYLWDYIEEHQPKIAFNELSFTVPDKLTTSTAVVIPVKNVPNREDYNIVFYPTVTDKTIPTVTLRPADCEYSGEPISADVFADNGSYAMADGKRIEGTWEFWTEPPLLPCNKQPCIISFIPTDPQYAPVDTITFITVSRSKTEFALKPHRTEISVWQAGQLVISGIPEDYKGTVTLRCNSDNEELKIKEVSCDDVTQREFEVDFPYKGGKFTFTAELSGDGLYLPASSQCSITVGDYVPPEEKPSDKITTTDELKALIASAAEGNTIRAEGMRSVPADIVKAASDKRLTLEVKLNDSYMWIVDTTKLSSQGELDLDISTAVIPAVLLDKVGGENLCSFNVFAKNLGNGAKLQVSSDSRNNSFANLFLYNTLGELKFVSCAPVRSDGTAGLEIKDPGKYAVMINSETGLKGDLNNDCTITLSDVQDLLWEYVSVPSSPKADGKYVKFDVDNNGIFNLSDVSTLLKIWVDN